MPRRAQRSHRYAGRRPQTGKTIATLVMMAVLLAGILFIGSDFASRLAGMFAPAEAPGEDHAALPPSLPGQDERDGGPRLTEDGALVPHSGALIRMAIRSATIVARRAIARDHVVPVEGDAPSPPPPSSSETEP